MLVELHSRYPLSRREDITDAYMRGFEAGMKASRGTCHCTTSDDAWCFSCSKCGKSFPRQDLPLARNRGKINFCPNCGSEVEKW